ncbi:hypothetical protein [Halorientalis salina]|uniref:hypothetical protein n=1 Tax=Halorientalis salina TaxID=2932266 RepID=UPI0010AC0BC0|nr:hypothetical protein [Halorientalis salina]
MERRKFLIGTGSLAAGSAAAMGTGAFTSVTANRTMEVKVADDASALLALDAESTLSNSVYADESGSAIRVNLDGNDINGDNSGSPAGVNKNAVTQILNIFKVKNHGTQNVFVYVPPTSVSPESVGEDGSSDLYIDPQASSLPHRVSYPDADSLSLTSVYLDDTKEETHNRDAFPEEAGYYEPEDFTLAPGESLNFGLHIDDSGSNFDGEISMNIAADAEYAASLSSGSDD